MMYRAFLPLVAIGWLACNAEPAPPAAAQQDAKPDEVPVTDGPNIVFASDSHDFGHVMSGDVLEHTFTFTNRGKEVLELGQPKGS